MNLDRIFNSLVDKLIGWVEALILLLPNFVVAVLIVVAAAVVAGLVRRGVLRATARMSSHTQVNKLFATLAYAFVLIAGTFIALGILGLDDTVMTLLAGVGIIGLALGFAFQDIAENFIAGILMAFRRPLTEGEIVETNGFEGVVQDVNLRTTIIRTYDGRDVFVPNKQVFQNPLVNYTRIPNIRVDIVCGVAYGDDLEKAERVAIEAIEAIEVRDHSRSVELFYDTFADSSINFTLRFWIEYRKRTDFLQAQSTAIKLLKRAFDENGITIPFPVRTLDFGVVGGEKLNEVLPQHLYKTDDGRT